MICKRIPFLILLLLGAVLVLAACGKEEEAAEQVQFYYRISGEQSYDAGSAVQSELRQLDCDTTDLLSVLQIYLAGPDSAELTSPFPRGTEVERLQQSGSQLVLVLSEEYAQLTGMNRTIADACLTLTMSSLDGVQSLTIYVSGEETVEVAAHTAEDYLLEDTGIEEREERIKIYFADSENRYLMGDQRSVVVSENESAAVYILQQLIAGPTDAELQATIPEGTTLLSVTEENGLCTVDFSAEFRENIPKTEAAERMTIYSIVNSLTELEGIDRVQILCQGQKIGIYRYMDLTEPFVRNADTIGPVRSGLNEFDATLYMQSWSMDYLAELPLRIQQTANQSREELVIEALIAYEPVNGLSNPIPSDTKLISVDTSNGVCRVQLSKEFAAGAKTVSSQRLRIIALVASLTALDGVESVLLTIEDTSNDAFSDFDLSQVILRSEDWFFP